MTTEPNRTHRLALAVLVVAAVVAGLLLWRDLRDDRPHAAAGAFATTGAGLPTQWRRTVLVPGTRYDVTAAVRDDVTDDPKIHTKQAPDGGSFVALGITASVRPGPTVPDDRAGDEDDPSDPRFTLVVDGERYALPSARDTAPSGVATPTSLPVNGWLAVAGRAGRLVLETSWQGRVQTVDLRGGDRVAGDFAPVYQQRSVGRLPSATTSCGTPVWTSGWRAGPGVAPACAFRADRLAWTASQGWAKAGRQWLALTTRMSVPTYLIHRVGNGDRRYRPSLYGDSSAQADESADSPDRLDGARPVGLRDVFEAPGEDGTAVLVFDVARTAGEHTAVVTQRVRPESRAGRSTYDGGVSQTWTVRIT